MALDFPANPINGQVYDSYVYNSTVGAWQAREDSRTVAILSSTVPTSANPGDIWVNTNDGISFVYYDDGTSAQWMELLPSGVPLLNTKANVDSPIFTTSVAGPYFHATANGTAQNFRVGDDVWLGDINVANTMSIRGVANAANAYIVFGSGDNTSLGRSGTGALTYGGNTVWHSGNDGSSSGLDADLLDGVHASSFAQLSGATFNGNITANAGGGDGLYVKPGSLDHAYISYFARTATPNTRTAYMGFGQAGNNNFTIANEIASSQIILSSAYVRMPNQPSFCARGVSNPTGTRSVYLFDQTIDFNIGSNYNSSTARFTAPVAGIYFFEFHLFGVPNTRYLATINKNGSGLQEYTQEQPNGAGTAQGYGSIDGKIVMSLAANDYVTVSGSATVIGTNNIYSSFSGYLIG